MRIQDIIRSILDTIDAPQAEPEMAVTVIDPVKEPSQDSPLTHAGDDIRRFRQIVDLADNGQLTQYANTPKEQYADVDSVTVDAGGGVNGPKHPSDIRGDHISLYPAHQHGVR
jgi:hypothetical protein